MPEAAQAVTALTGYLDTWFEGHRRRTGCPGIQVSVRVGGDELLSRAYGLADAATGEELSPGHLFRIASHSKTLAAMTAMRLREQGTLSLDTRADQHVDDLPEALGALTVRDLLEHRGGVIRDGVAGDFWQLTRDFPDDEDLRGELGSDGQTFPANTHFKYSNIAYGLLGLVIGAAHGGSYGEAARTLVLDPLGLEPILVDTSCAEEHVLARGHALAPDQGGASHVLPSPATGALAAATGLAATASATTALFASLLPGTRGPLSEESRRVLLSHRTLLTKEDGSEAGVYGLGLDFTTVAGQRLPGHSGGFPGVVTRTLLDPRHDMVVSVLTNMARGPAHDLAVGLMHTLTCAIEATEEESQEEAPVERADTGRYHGLFGPSDVVTLGAKAYLLDGRATDPMTEAQELVADEGGLRLVDEDGFGFVGEPVRFDPPADGMAHRALRVGGVTMLREEDYLSSCQDRGYATAGSDSAR